MTTKGFWTRGLAVAAVLAGALSSCGAGEAGDALAPQKAWLSRNDYVMAEAEFRRFIKAYPHDPEIYGAKFGLAMSLIGQFADKVSYIAALALNVSNSAEAVADFGNRQPKVKAQLQPLSELDFSGKKTPDENSYLNNAIRKLLNDHLAFPLAEAVQLLNEVATQPGFEFRIEGFKLLFLETEFVDFSGEWDVADVHVLRGVVGLLAAATNLIASVDLGMPFYDFVHALMANKDDVLGDITSAELLNTFVRMLTNPEYPNLLKYAGTDTNGNGSPDGPELFAYSRTALLAFADGLASARAAIAAEKKSDPDQSDDIFVAGAFGPNEIPALELRNRVRMDDLDKFLLDANKKGVAGTFDLMLPDESVAALGRLRANLERAGVTPGGVAPDASLIRLGADVLTIASPPAMSIANAIKLSPGVSAIIGIAATDPLLLVEIAKDYIPDALAFDPAMFYVSRPVVRDLLPKYRTDADPMQNNFYAEWECPAEITPFPAGVTGTSSAFPAGGHLTCQTKAYTDADHFKSPYFADVSVETLAADTITSGWPVFAYGEPSFGGLLYIDAAEMRIPGAPAGFKPASNRALNAYIGRVGQRFSPD